MRNVLVGVAYALGIAIVGWLIWLKIGDKAKALHQEPDQRARVSVSASWGGSDCDKPEAVLTVGPFDPGPVVGITIVNGSDWTILKTSLTVKISNRVYSNTEQSEGLATYRIIPPGQSYTFCSTPFKRWNLPGELSDLDLAVGGFSVTWRELPGEIRGAS